jgi:hypothetical protein
MTRDGLLMIAKIDQTLADWRDICEKIVQVTEIKCDSWHEIMVTMISLRETVYADAFYLACQEAGIGEDGCGYVDIDKWTISLISQRMQTSAMKAETILGLLQELP